MKKLLSVAVIAGASLLLAACATVPMATEAPSTGTEQANEPVI